MFHIRSQQNLMEQFMEDSVQHHSKAYIGLLII